MSSSSSTDGTDEEEIIRNFEGKLILQDLLPKKSVAKYEMAYEAFMKWKETQKANSFDENVLLVYFDDLSKRLKPSTLWSQWSMLKTTLNLKHAVNINGYEQLKTLLKNKSKGFKATKSMVLTWSQINEFSTLSDDNQYLAAKVILIFGIFGAMRCQEFCNISVSDIEDTGSQFIVTIKDTKNYYPRNFIIGAEFYEKVKQYKALRPTYMETNRFFIKYQNGTCIRQVIGKNKINEVPRTVAEFLNLEAPERYTGHCMRRTAATLLANSGANLTTVKQLGGWKSSTVAEGYIENSLANRRKIFEGIADSDPGVRVNSPTITSATTSTIASASVCIASSSNELMNADEDTENYPPFSIDEIDESALIKPKPSTSAASTRPSCSTEALKHALENRDDLRPTKKKATVPEEKQSLSKQKLQSTVVDEINSKAAMNQFHNCVIHNITNNYYLSNDKQ